MEFKELIKNRRSIRKFKDKEVPREVLEELMDMVILSPTAMNRQGRHYTLIQDKEKINKLEDEMAKALGKEGYNFMGAPVLVLISTADTSLRAIQDTSIAQTYFYLAAEELGLGACWINQFLDLKSEDLKELLDSFGIPKENTVYGAMVLGYKDQHPDEKPKSEPVLYLG